MRRFHRETVARLGWGKLFSSSAKNPTSGKGGQKWGTQFGMC